MADAMETAASVEDAHLRLAEKLTREALEAAAKADPLRDGSYAGDASKRGMIDTPDLEARDHALAEQARADAVRPGASFLRQAPGAKPAGPVEGKPAEPVQAWHAPAWTPEQHELDPAAERRAEADAQAREAAWARAHGVRLPEDDGL